MTHQSRDRFVWCHNSSAWWAGEERGHLDFRSPSFPASFGGLGEGTPPGIEKQKWHVTQVSHAIYRREKTLLPLVGFSYSWVNINTSWRAKLQTIWYTLFSPKRNKNLRLSLHWITFFCRHEKLSGIAWTVNAHTRATKTNNTEHTILKHKVLKLVGQWELFHDQQSREFRGTSLLTYRNVYIGSIEFSICRRRLLQKTNNNETSEYVFVNNIIPETSSSKLKSITFEEFTLKKQRQNKDPCLFRVTGYPTINVRTTPTSSPYTMGKAPATR